jgi:hypothetical protein
VQVSRCKMQVGASHFDARETPNLKPLPCNLNLAPCNLNLGTKKAD